MLSRLLTAILLLTISPIAAQAQEPGNQPSPKASQGDLNPGKKYLGIAVRPTKRGIRIKSIFQDSPGDKGGLKAGDLLEKINGKSTLGMSSQEFNLLAQEKDPVEIMVVPQEGAPQVVSLNKAAPSTFQKTLAGPPASLLEVAVGQEAPDLEAITADGKKIKLSELRGKLVILNFTASWCYPCKLEAPKLVAAYEKFKGQGLEIISIYVDEAGMDVFAYAKTLSATWPIRGEGKGWEDEAARTYGIGSVPTNILVGKDGKILDVNFRGPDQESRIEKAL